MQRISSIEDDMRGVVTYALAGGRRICLDARAVELYGAAALIRDAGHGDGLPTRRIPVLHCGRQVGTLPPDFDTGVPRSRSFLYEPRPGDFVRDGDKVVADRMMGPGDLDLVVGFVRTG